MTATTAGLPLVISAPVPQAFPFNLLTVAQEVPPAVEGDGGLSQRWLNGADIFSYTSSVGNGIDPCNLGTNRLKDDGEDFVFPRFGAFTGYVPVTCTALNLTWDEFKQRANAVLMATDPYRAEKQLVSGLYKMDNPFLADTNATLLHSGTAVSPKEGLALLQNAIGATGRAGVIHADPATVVAWDALGTLVEVVRGQLQTTGGTPVAQGAGYIGVHPIDGSTASGPQSWAYATGPVLYQLGSTVTLPDNIAQALDRSDNTVTYRAEHDMLVAWDTQLQAAVLVDRSL